tara:strand:- start:394 stop:528 length:135 start_codon:yes stop_codon:yes gene_type:complete
MKPPQSFVREPLLGTSDHLFIKKSIYMEIWIIKYLYLSYVSRKF